MISIVTYSEKNYDLTELKTILQDFLIDFRIMAKVSFFTDKETLLTTPNRYDIYIMDLDCGDEAIELAKRMMEIDEGSHYIFIGSDPTVAYKASEIHADYFIIKQNLTTALPAALQKIKKDIQVDNIIIKTADGERRLRVNCLNYINIIRRCLCYHLTDGAVFDGQTLRSSFEKAIDPLQHHKAFLFIAPSLLINIGEIQQVNNDHLIFENGDVLYFPKVQHDKVIDAWKNYTRILDF